MTLQLFDVLRDRISQPINLIDVGAAGGALEGWHHFGEKARIFCFEARDDESTNLTSANNSSNIEYIPYALAEDDNGIDLNIATIPTCSSSYVPIKRLYERYPGCAIIQPVETVHCRSISLDGFLESRNIGQVHGIKLDTQGAELNILRGAKNALRKCLFAIIEVEFNSLYENQPLFCDVDKFMRDQGFVLWRLNNLAHYSTGVVKRDEHAMMIGSDPGGHHMVPLANGQLFWGDAIYVKAAATPLSDDKVALDDAIAGAALAVQWRFWDLALEFIRKSGDVALLATAREILGVNFVKDLKDRVDADEFRSQLNVQHNFNGWTLDLSTCLSKECLIYGPYMNLPEGEMEATFHLYSNEPVRCSSTSRLVFDVAQDQIRKRDVVLTGSDEISSLKDGSVKLQFANHSPNSLFEFRVYFDGQPVQGHLRFDGVSLRRIPSDLH